MFYAQISEAMRWAPAVFEEVAQDYARLSGRQYSAIETYRMEDAEVAILAMGSVCGTTRTVVDALRSEGVKAGMVKLRMFRPFPVEGLAKASTPNPKASAYSTRPSSWARRLAFRRPLPPWPCRLKTTAAECPS
jgi:pyruvate ferredoxin oxidoreductase alpha subunit